MQHGRIAYTELSQVRYRDFHKFTGELDTYNLLIFEAHVRREHKDPALPQLKADGNQRARIAFESVHRIDDPLFLCRLVTDSETQNSATVL